jgi:uncharacterized protein (DUF342 family)
MAADSDKTKSGLSAEASAAARQKLEHESRLPAKGNLLYLLYCSLVGIAPNISMEATFSLELFTQNKEPPTREQRSWLIAMERKLHTLPQFTALLAPPAPTEAFSFLDNTVPFPLGESPFGAEIPPLEEKPVPLPAPRPTGGLAAVYIEADGMHAFLFLLPPTGGGLPLTPQQVYPFLAGQQVRFGINEQTVEEACARKRYLTLIPVAAGTLPVHGEDGYIVDHFRRKTEIHYALREDGTMDYRDLGWLQTAEKDQLISEAIPPTPPVAGTTVRGTEMPGRPGKTMLPPSGGGTRLSEDKTRLLAELDGVVGFSFQRFTVTPLLIIQGDVDNTVGDLDVLGDVIIHGDVLEGFNVQATGSITVRGMVEAARLAAGTDIRVGLGINGAGAGHLAAGRDILCKFIENTTVTAGGSVVCDAIVGATVTCDDSLFVNTGKGALIGGAVTVQNRIQAKVIGTANGRQIDLILGSPADFLDEQHELEEKLAELKEQLEAREKNLEFLSQDAPVPQAGQPDNTDGLKNSILLYRRRVLAAQRSLDELISSRKDYSHCRLIAGTLHTPANVSIGHAFLPVRQTIMDVEMYYADNKVALRVW